jgi:hypothetical protein
MAGVAAGAVILVPLIGVILNSVLSGGSLLLYIPFFFLMMAYTDPVQYVAINLAVMLLALVALIWARPGRAAMAWLVASIIVIVAYPLTLGDYQPALAARPGLRMVIATQPVSLLDRVTKRAEVSIEKRVCLYHLLGWAQDGKFYYESTCVNVHSNWSIDPDAESRPKRVVSAPADLEKQAMTTGRALRFLSAPGVRPQKFEPVAAPILLADGEAMISADGRWLAVVSQHVYGPQDVLLIRLDE